MIPRIFPKGRFSLLCFALLCIAYDKLFVKVIAASIEDSIVEALYHLRVSRKKEKYIQKKEQQSCERVFRRQQNSANQYGHLDFRSVL